MYDFHSPNANTQAVSATGKKPACARLHYMRTQSAGLAAIWLFSLLLMDLTAGPKYRAFQKSPSNVDTPSDVRQVSAASHFHGEVSDSPPIFINGEFSTIGGASISSPRLLKSQKPMATMETANPGSERHYQVKANSLQYGLLRMAALYQDLRGSR